MTRGGKNTDTAGGPTRKCVATGQVRPKGELVRFVLGPEGVITPDVRGKLPGRGIWVSARSDALEKAASRGLFAWAAKAQATVPATLVRDVEKALAARVVEFISLARKAGGAVAGFEKAKSWLESGRAAVLIQASDGSERGKDKLRSPPGKANFIGVLTSSELGLAFGRENVIHGALATGGLTGRVVEEAARLGGLRDSIGEKYSGKGKKTE